jgi:two-component system, LytTR family, sensor kinase
MKIHLPEKILKPFSHLLFWFISLNFWCNVLNPGVESVSVVRGLNDLWPYFLLACLIYFIYFLLPLTWFLKKAGKWIKIISSAVFLIPFILLLFGWIFPGTLNIKDSFFDDFFVFGFLYVLVFHLTIVAAVYYNLKVLIPRFLVPGRFGIYFLSFACLTVVSAFLNFGLYNFVIDQIFPSLFFISTFKVWELIIILAIYLLLTTLLFLIRQYILFLIANREKAQNELSALKAQINPHFLFNNLNTIYSLASQNDAHTKDVIMKLSDFLRYVLYDTNSDFIPLEKEVEVIKTYVDLQKERIDPEIIHILFFAEGDFSNTKIAPMLLLPFAENCFKHGIGKQEGEISLNISLNGKRLSFSTANPISIREKADKEENGGIGVKNVEKRLNLLYPGRHTLRFEEKEGIFRVKLSVDLE